MRLYSRKQLSFAARFPALVNSLQALGHEAVLDGEVVVLDDAGRPQFQLLQNYPKTSTGALVYQVFDLLYLDGRDLQDLPLRRRKELLAQILADLPNVRLSEHIPAEGIAFFKAISERGLEGMVAKNAQSRYRQGVRSHSWLKIKTHLRQEAVIAGFTEPKGSRKHFGALLLGVFAGNELVSIGHVGSGFTEATLSDMRGKLEPLVQKVCPFKQLPRTNAPARWVQPKVVCEVSFDGWSADGHLRHPVFLGLREDQPATEVRREVPEPVARIVPKPLIDPPAGRVVPVTNLAKLYWPQNGITKGDVIDFYRQMAGVLLPYLKDRPLSLRRHPNGIEGKSFFQKDVSHQPPPDWVQTVLLSSGPGEQKMIRAVVCPDEPTLIYLANLGCIELHPWSSRIGSLDQPDYVVIDLDPEGVSFDEVIKAAQQTRKILQQLGVEGYCKTSGQRGLHIAVPFGARYHYEQARQFAKLIACLVHTKLPGSTSLARHPAKRQKRVYLDYLQNGMGKTIAAPYSLRAYPGATVSTPLKWTEVKRGLDPGRFTSRTVAKRLERMGDLWKAVLGQGIDLQAALERWAPPEG